MAQEKQTDPEKHFLIKKHRSRRKVNDGPLRDPKYLKWLGQTWCVVTQTYPGFEGAAKLDVHHIRLDWYAGQMKPPDNRCLPIRRDLHLDQYPGAIHCGEKIFWEKAGIDPFELSSMLYNTYSRGGSPQAARSLISAYREIARIRRTYNVPALD